MRTEFLAAYEKLNRINKKTLEKEGKEAENYSYVDYEDFVLIFSRILKYFTGLEIKLSFTDLPNSYALSIYGNEEQLSKLAEKAEYELQLKNYALKYEKILEEANMKNPGMYTEDLLSGSHIGEDRKKLLANSYYDNTNNAKMEWVPLKYSDLREKNSLCFTPVEKYRHDKEENFKDIQEEMNITNAMSVMMEMKFVTKDAPNLEALIN